MKKIEFTHTYENSLGNTVQCKMAKPIRFLMDPKPDEVTVKNEYGSRVVLKKTDIKEISK